jgi:hypothetical protein
MLALFQRIFYAKATSVRREVRSSLATRTMKHTFMLIHWSLSAGYKS